MRRLALVVCTLGLLLALPVSAAVAKVIDVPGTAVFRAGNNGAANCTAYVFVQWPEQANASAWQLEYEYLKGTADILTYEKKSLFPPFDDEPTGVLGWVPPAGAHWYFHTYRSKSFPGHTVECASLEAEMLGRVLTATVHITVPDDPEEAESGDDDSTNDDSDGDDPSKSSKDKGKTGPKIGREPRSAWARLRRSSPGPAPRPRARPAAT